MFYTPQNEYRFHLELRENNLFWTMSLHFQFCGIDMQYKTWQNVAINWCICKQVKYLQSYAKNNAIQVFRVGMAK